MARRLNRTSLGLILAALLQALVVSVAAADEAPEFEARGVIEQVDSSWASIVLDGQRYRLSETVQVYGTRGGQYQLKPGQRISFELDSGRSEPTITKLTVMEPDKH